MPEVVGVTFRSAGKVYYFSTNGLDLKVGDMVIVETVRGTEIARISLGVKEILDSEIAGDLRSVLRLAQKDDLISKYQKRLLSYRALKICKRKIRHHNLDMKLVDVEYALDGSKIVFYFSADGRVDFRNLVRELAGIFKKRIELHQIGVRDEAKILGGIGPCGRAVCCNVFMPEFAPVSIKMAKEQNLSLNPERISGSCGRFMCCLKHEYEVYHEALKIYPTPGSIVGTPDGEAKVVEQYIAKGALLVENQNKGRFEVKIDDVLRTPAKTGEGGRDNKEADRNRNLEKPPANQGTNLPSEPRNTSAAEQKNEQQDGRFDRSAEREHPAKQGQKRGQRQGNRNAQDQQQRNNEERGVNQNAGKNRPPQRRHEPPKGDVPVRTQQPADAKNVNQPSAEDTPKSRNNRNRRRHHRNRPQGQNQPQRNANEAEPRNTSTVQAAKPRHQAVAPDKNQGGEK